MKRVISVFLIAMLFAGMCFSALAEDSPVVIPGEVWLPSFSGVVQKEPSSEEQLPDGSLKQIFQDVSEKEVNSFHAYAVENGCKITGQSSANGASVLLMENYGKIFSMIYDTAARSVEVVYSFGSTPEKFRIGDVIAIGAYEQDNDLSNGSEPIEWIVLAVKGEKALLISKYALDCKKYKDVSENNTWEKSSLRRWLNGEFYQTAFNREEQKQILLANVTADKNSCYNTDPGNDTEDEVFLLSIPEAEKYFVDTNERRCAPTTYAAAQGAYVISKNYKTVDDLPACWWWLRSPGGNRNNAANVYSDGQVSYSGNYVITTTGYVRPALWITLDSSNR